MFPDDPAAERWFIDQRWPDGIACHWCGSINVQTGCAHKTMPFRCRDCRKRFSVRTGTVMQSSKLGFQVWLVAMYLVTTSLKGVSSMKLHRDLKVTQKRVRLFFVGGRISLYGSEAGGNWIRHGVVREQRRGPVADGTCAVSDGWGCSAGTRALGGGSQYASMRRRPVAA